MKSSKVTKKPKTQVPSSSTFLAHIPNWLTAISALLLAALASLFYFFLRGPKSKSRQTNLSGIQPFETKQAANPRIQAVRLGPDGQIEPPVFHTSAESSAEIEQEENTGLSQAIQAGALREVNENPPFLKITWSSGSPVTQWLESINSWSLPDLTIDQIRKIAYSLTGPFLAILLAYLAQGIFGSITGDRGALNWTWLIALPVGSRLWLGAGVYLISMVIWIFTAPTVYSISTALAQQSSTNAPTRRYHPLRFASLLLSICLYFVSILLFITVEENSFIRALWLAGLIFFIVSQVPWPRFPQNPHPDAEESPRFRWQNWLVLALILGVAFWLRFYQLGVIPADLHGDMASYGQQARDFLLGQQHNIFDYGWADIPMMGYLPTLISMAVFGDNIFGLQMTALIGGLLSLLAVYLLVWRLFNSHRLAALTTGLVAINIAHIHFSRIAAYMDPWPFSYFALFFLIDGLKARRSVSFGLAGICLGLGLQMYYSGRVMFLIIGLFLIYAFFFQRPWITQNKRRLVLMVLGLLLAMGPGLVFNATHWSSYIERSREVIIFAPDVLHHLMGKYNVNSVFAVLLTQIRLSLLMFNFTSDSGTQFGYAHPMFSSLLSPLIFLGLGYSLRRWKEPGLTLVLIWLGLTMVLGSILTVDAPFWPRLVGVVPAAALLAALALDQMFELVGKILGSRASVLVTALVVILLITVGCLNWNQYYLTVKENAAPTVVTGRYINSLPADVTACSLLSGPPLIVRETYFLAWPRKLVDIKPDAPDTDLDSCTGSALVWVISPENISRLEAIRLRWPNGVVHRYTFPNSDYTMTFYLVGINPPALAPEALFGKNPWPAINKNIFIFIGVVLLGISAWWIWVKRLRNRDLRSSIEKIVKTQPGLPTIEINWHALRPRYPSGWSKAALKAGWTDFSVSLDKWYDNLIAFELPRMNPGLLFVFFLSLTAVGLVYFAQTFLDQQKSNGLHLPVESFYLLTENQRLEIACIIFVAAALLWTGATIYMKKVASQAQNLKPETSEIDQPQIAEISRSNSGKLLHAAGLFCTFSAMFIYALMDENSLVRWLWVIGLALFLVSVLVENRFSAVKMNEESPPFRWYHSLSLGALILLAFCMRVYRLYDIPLDLSTDMASVGLSARDYLLGGEQQIFGIGWFYMPRIAFLPYVLSMRLVGNNLFGLYFATVIMGTLNVLGTYLFTWRLFDRHRLALLTAALVTINPAHINYSRITSYIDPWFLGFFGLFFLIDGLKGRRKVSLALAGLLTGFALLNYPSGRAIIPMIGFLLAAFWFYKRIWISDNYAGLRWMLLGMLVALGPNLIYVITNWSTYMQRSQEVFIFFQGNMDHLKYTYQVDTTWMVVWEQVKRSVLLFNYYTDRSAQFAYPHPLFNSLVSPLLILGLGLGLYRWRKPEFLFVIASFIFILLTGSILSNDAPTWCRLVGLIPLATLLVALVIDELMNVLEGFSLKPFVPFIFLGVILFLAVLAMVDWNTYIGDVKGYARPVVRVGRYLDSLPKEINACGITDGYPMDQAEIKFLAWPRSIVAVPADTAKLTAEICPGPNLVWILSPTYQNRLPEIQSLWPGGTIEDHRLENGDLMFTSYLIYGK
jgi:4-amino-4-deoxy-L-arabinose transferase-like glycosyltransferase